MDEVSKSLWARVCATVTRLGEPRGPRVPKLIEVPQSTILDLHGMTVEQAHARTHGFLASAPRTVTIITGKSGVIRREFPRWLDDNPRVTQYVELNGGGAFEIKVR